MAGDLYYDGPVPDYEAGPMGFCTVCSMIFRGFANETDEVKDMVNLVNGLGPGEQRRIDIGKLKLTMARPEPAVTLFVSPILQGIIGQMMGLPPGMVPPPLAVGLCWGHLTGLQLKPGGGVIPATADQLPPEQRGAVDLSKRRG